MKFNHLIIKALLFMILTGWGIVSLPEIGLASIGTQKGLAQVDAQLGLTLPCVSYKDQAFSVVLKTIPHPSDSASVLWTPASITTSAWTGDCATLFASTFDLVVPCAEYQGGQYALVFESVDLPSDPDGLYWQLSSLYAVAPSDTLRNTALAVSASDTTQMANDLNAFNFSVYDQIRNDDGNLFYSPYSLFSALMMVWAGSSGQTRTQMKTVLHLSMDDSLIHPAANALEMAVTQPVSTSGFKTGDSFTCRVDNTLWGQPGYPFLQSYLDLMAEHYGARLGLLDFANGLEPARKTINDWIEKNTAGRIKNLIAPNVLNPLTKLILTNAVYFKASWQNPFETQQTMDKPFTLLDNTTVTVPMMTQTESFSYGKFDTFQLVVLPYIGGKASMVILVPDKGSFSAFEASLDANLFSQIMSMPNPISWCQKVQLTMPRFSVEWSRDYVALLKQMGMTDAFDPGTADFSGIDGTQKLYIDKVFQKAWAAVDEAGTEAAAATYIAMPVSMPPPSQPEVLNIDRPFIFAIQDTDTKAILFMGRVLSP